MFDGFSYTRTGNNLCHARTLGLLAKAAWSLDATAAVEIDVRLNRGRGVKFQPDILIRGHQDEILAAVDFESPNSSDARVPYKDVTAYLRWATTSAQSFEYLIITSLPDRPTSTLELRYASAGKWNENHVRAKIQRNPFRYWYRHYKNNIDPRWRNYPLTFANFDGLSVKVVDVDSVS